MLCTRPIQMMCILTIYFNATDLSENRKKWAKFELKNLASNFYFLTKTSHFSEIIDVITHDLPFFEF